MNITRREKHFLIAAALIALYFVFNPARIPEDQEIFYLLFIVVPLGFYLATDPERRKKESVNGSGTGSGKTET